MDRELEELVWERAGHRCEYCQVAQEFDRLPFEIGHIIAHKHGGATRASNLCLACFACNHHTDRGRRFPTGLRWEAA